MKHWHQCVKYTLPQCSFQFIFLLVSYVYKKRAAKKKEVTEEDQSLSDDWGWHFVILSLAQEGPPLIPCINTSFIFCHHRLHCANDVMPRSREIPVAAQSTLAAPNTVRSNPVDVSLIRFLGAGFLLGADKVRGEGRARGLPSSPSHAFVQMKFYCFLVLKLNIFKWRTSQG